MTHEPRRATFHSIAIHPSLARQGRKGREGMPGLAVRQSEIEHTGTRTRPLAERRERAVRPHAAAVGAGVGGACPAVALSTLFPHLSPVTVSASR